MLSEEERPAVARGHPPGPSGRVFVALVAPLLFAMPAAPAQKKAAPAPDSDCLACHPQPDFKSEKGRSLYMDYARHQAGAQAEVERHPASPRYH